MVLLRILGMIIMTQGIFPNIIPMSPPFCLIHVLNPFKLALINYYLPNLLSDNSPSDVTHVQDLHTYFTNVLF